jgi:hypothetical protein
MWLTGGAHASEEGSLLLLPLQGRHAAVTTDTSPAAFDDRRPVRLTTTSSSLSVRLVCQSERGDSCPNQTLQSPSHLRHRRRRVGRIDLAVAYKSEEGDPLELLFLPALSDHLSIYLSPIPTIPEVCRRSFFARHRRLWPSLGEWNGPAGSPCLSEHSGEVNRTEVFPVKQIKWSLLPPLVRVIDRALISDHLGRHQASRKDRGEPARLSVFVSSHLSLGRS